jgi:cellulose synthase/poly-beta-1,6-N-acetylglucosamine synthase-like glycosyltransferase
MDQFWLNAALFINYFSLYYVVAISTIYLIQLIAASIGLKKYVKSLRYKDYDRFQDSANMVPISVLVPAFNEEATIVDTVNNLLTLNYPTHEVIVINDGSTDDTLSLLIDSYHMRAINEPYRKSLSTQPIQKIYRSAECPNLIVVDKLNGGKADSLNAGINVSKYPVFVTIDADSILENNSLMKIIYTFMADPSCVAVGGIVRIASGCRIEKGKLVEVNLPKKPLQLLQTNEYLRAFLTGRISFDVMGMLLIISGAFGAFQKKAVIEAGGYTVGCVGEDMELIVKLHEALLRNHKKYTVRFLPDPVCWTEPPEKISDLKKQRKRWHIGLMDTLFRHKKMTFHWKYGKVGMLCMPYYWLFEFLGPVIETIGYFFVPISWALGIVNLHFMLSFLLLSILYGTFLSVGALLLEENTFRKYPDVSQILKLFLYAVLDNLGYRQLNSIFKVEAMIGYRKNRSSWGKMKRKGFEN